MIKVTFSANSSRESDLTFPGFATYPEGDAGSFNQIHPSRFVRLEFSSSTRRETSNFGSQTASLCCRRRAHSSRSRRTNHPCRSKFAIFNDVRGIREWDPFKFFSKSPSLVLPETQESTRQIRCSAKFLLLYFLLSL